MERLRWSHSQSAVGHIIFGFIIQNLKKNHESVQASNTLTIFVSPPLLDGVDFKSIMEKEVVTETAATSCGFHDVITGCR